MCNFRWCEGTQPYSKCCLNWDFLTCSSFVRLLFFFQVHAAKTSNIKIKLFFAYHIGNNLYRKEQSLYPQNLHPILKRQIQHFPSTRPHSPVWPTPLLGDMVGWLHAILHCFPIFMSCFPCDWLILFIKQLVIECLTKKCLQAVFLVHNCLAEGNNNLGLNFSPPLSLSYHHRWRCCLCLKGKTD